MEAAVHLRRLDDSDNAALEELLESDITTNLFLLGFLEAHATARSWWYGAIDDEDRLLATCLVLPRRLAVPFGNAQWMREIGLLIAQYHAPTKMLVGPRAASDALWSSWAPAVVPLQRADQRLYVLQQAPQTRLHPGFRPARSTEWQALARYAASMEREDLGFDPYDEDPATHERVVRDRIESGRTWVIEHDGDLVFTINLGTDTHYGCQVGGTYVPPRHRGKGWSVIGMRSICQVLLGSRPMVTLHVNEANTPAVRCYERTGFVRSTPFRLQVIP